jgi:PAS domain S-box-containing protein
MAANEPLMLLDVRRRVAAVNRAALKLHRIRSAGWLIGRNLRDLLPARWRRQVPRQFRGVDRKSRGRWETQHVRSDGVELEIEASVQRLSTIAWRGYAYLARDISSRKRAEEQLHLAELAQRRLAEQLAAEKARLVEAQAVARVGSCETDLPTGVMTWSAETHRIFETDPATFQPTHRRFMRLVHPDDRPKVEKSFAASLKTRGASLIEHRIRLSDGRIKHVSERWRTFFDARGRPIRAVGTCQDITKSKLRDLELRRSQESLANAQRLAGIGSWEIDLPTERLHRSDQTFRIFGLRPAKHRATYSTFLQRVHPADREAMHAAHLAAVSGKAKMDFVHRIVQSDKSVRFVHELGELTRDQQGRPIRLAGTIHDITERRRTDEELRARESQLHTLVARLNSVREEEAKRIARELHDDLGQRLTAIDMEVTALELALPKATAERPAPIARIRTAVDQAIQVVQKISSELRVPQLDLLGLTAAIEWQLKEFSRLSGISCRATRLDEAADLSDAQRTALFRILQEALTNVARHAAASAVSVSLTADCGHLTLNVRDNGRGIAAGELQDRKSIGLLGMRERAQAAGGTVRILGAPGRGTTVSVSLPRPPAPPKAP